MATATAVATFIEAGEACLAIRVENDSGTKAVEYIGRVPITPEFTALSNAGKKAALVAACKAVRDTQKVTLPAAPSVTGSLTV